ncbi:hypothetical protein PVL29_013692 [Vitis rotundifolia]|uniref:AAA+ ATPase domain-containing protein n=1 Tax=Vitis rotundifolia TaxID=103349 RepID=A0AA38ZMJ9_VITRO|nr:hypothetical protein PVL29_013692 [Vitis rotundifolia]
MVEIVISVAAKVAEYLVDPITRQLGYLFNYRRNMMDLNQQIDSLHLARVRLQIPVDEANRQGDDIFPGVQEWLTYAEGIIQKRDDFNEDEREASKSCFYLKSRYQLSKQANKQAAEIVDKIQGAHNFGVTLSCRPPPPPPFISAASFKDYEAFQSRESTFNQIMEALRNEGISMIGVCGMGGVGKTTLVKQVAQRVEEDKLFHKVVMAPNISQTPNFAEIQEKIARMLGLKFEEEDRAGRLRQRLKKEEKILVILDDGCKVLLTSREIHLLSKDMRTQKEFRLQHLSQKEAWNLFKKRAGDSVEKPELHSIAVDVAKECEGLPVAIVTIANALRNERVGVWENALQELRRAAPTNIRGVSKKVYSCLELSYNHLEDDEIKSLFLLCALLGDGDISMDRLLQYAMGLNLFKGIYSWDEATNKLITLVENPKASSLLLDGEDEDDEKSLFFDESMLFRMHDVVHDVARAIASKDPHRFVVKEAVGLQHVELQEWQWMDECRNCTRISLKCKNIDELPQGLVCPQLEFFSLNSSYYSEIPDAFFQETTQLRVLDLSQASLTPSPSSLGFLSILRTLCLNGCMVQDIALIVDLKRLQVLSLANSRITQLPKEMMQLSDLRVLDLRNCSDLKLIPRNVISSLSRLEYLSMKGSSHIEWQAKRFNSRERINACLSELKHLPESPHNVIALWHNQLPADSFSKLKNLHVSSCYELLNVFPLSVAKALVQLEDLQIDSSTVEAIVATEDEDEATHLLLFPKLTVGNCDEVEILFQEIGLEGELDNKIQQPLFLVEKVIQVERLPSEEFHVNTLPQLTEIYLEDLPMLMHLFGLGPYFPRFQTLKIDGCRSLIYLVTPSMAKRLVQLKMLIIRKCHMMKEIVGNEGDEPTYHKIEFTRLTTLKLDCLPNLKSFCSTRYTFQFPSWETMMLVKCPKMEFFCKGVLDTPRLKCVQMGYHFFELCWKCDLNTTIHTKFMNQPPMLLISYYSHHST